MKSERRCAHRERPEELSYIQFEPEGGGIVLNASEQGLAFQASSALRRNGPIQLCVSPNPMAQIKLTAEIAWMDETQKSGGLRFTELTADARNQILQWLTQTRQSQTPAEEFTVSSGLIVEETEPGLSPGNETPKQLSSAPRVWRAPATSPLRTPIFTERQEPLRPRLLSGLAVGFLILVFVFMPIFISRNLRQEIGNSLIRMGQKLRGNGDALPDPSSSIPVHLSSRNSVSTPSVANPIRGNSASDSSDHADPAASTQTNKVTASSADYRLADRQHSRKNIADSNVKRGRSTLARQLWAALGAGDRSAEVPLAQLYLTGDGVPRNCEQAWVLLRAAAKNGNVEALQQLGQLKKRPCR